MSDERSTWRLEDTKRHIEKCRTDSFSKKFIRGLLFEFVTDQDTPVELLIGMANVIVAARQAELENEARSN